MNRKLNAVGMQSGRLTATAEDGKYVIADCSCGAEVRVLRVNFLAKYSKSCGCFRNDKIREACMTHGQSRTPLHNIWKAMHQRCYNPNRTSYPWYGAKGVKVCQLWHDFQNFYNDMAAEYVEGLSIDRLDSDGDYEPSNCRWLTKSENSRRGHG